MPPPFPARRSADLKRPAATPRLCPGAGTCQERRERRIMTAAARRRAYARGRRGERIAAWWLRLKGYRVLALGFRCPVGEIDLVARRGGRSEEHTSELQSLMRISFAVFCWK